MLVRVSFPFLFRQDSSYKSIIHLRLSKKSIQFIFPEIIFTLTSLQQFKTIVRFCSNFTQVYSLTIKMVTGRRGKKTKGNI